MKRNNGPIIELATLVTKAPWWVGFGLAGAMLLLSAIVGHIEPGRGLLPIGKILVAPLLKMVALLFAVAGAISLSKNWFSGKLFNATNSLQDVKALSWQQFEFLIGEYYRRKGYSVFQMGGDAPDGGIDLLASKNGEKLVVQCKHWKAFKIDVKVARELYGVMVDSTASGAVLITSGGFTQPAVDFVKDKPIELIDGPRLEKLIAEVQAATAKAPAAMAQAAKQPAPYIRRAVLVPTEPPPLKQDKDVRYMPPAMRREMEAKDKPFSDATPVCPKCNKPMVLRVAHHGATPGAKFWGCSNYPTCSHTAPA